MRGWADTLLVTDAAPTPSPEPPETTADTPLPCPFCASPRCWQADDLSAVEWAIECAECKARGPISGDEAESIAQWNARASSVSPGTGPTPDGPKIVKSRPDGRSTEYDGREDA